ncbi:MAG: 50S ribosomal protein L10 [Parcubacteria group bacterium]|nr:50S ribosomal protein L10 [Parcubacteria group bacterium]
MYHSNAFVDWHYILAKSKQRKQEELSVFSKKLKDAKMVLFTSFAEQSKKGINVANMRKLKRGLRNLDSEYVVIKKTLAKKAFDDVTKDIQIDTKKLSGSVGFILGFGDQIAPTQFIYKFSRENEALKILGGLLDTKILSGKEVIELAKLPGREVILAQLACTIKAPLQGLHNVLQANLKNLVVVLGQIRK